MERHTSTEDLCGVVCQHLAAYVKFVWVDDSVGFIFLKKRSDLNDVVIPLTEKTVPVKQIFFSSICRGSLPDLFTT